MDRQDASTTDRCVLAAIRMGRTARPTPSSWVLTVLTLVVMLAASAVRSGDFRPSAGLVTAVVVIWAPLVARTYSPLLTLATTVLLECGYIAVGAHGELLHAGGDTMGAYQPVPIAVAVAAWTVASRTPRSVGWTAGVASGVVEFAVGALTQPPDLLLTGMTAMNVILIATGLGVFVATRRDRAAAIAREITQDRAQAVFDERLRIARELHDALAHNLTLVNAKAGVAEYLARTDSVAAADALRDITLYTGRAIDELRATLGLLRRDGADDVRYEEEWTLAPTPGLGRLDEMVQTLRSTGARVVVDVVGIPGVLDTQASRAAYRIIQEALTNAAKHATGEKVTVRMTWQPGWLDVNVSNPVGAVARTSSAPQPNGSGHGLIGMRERANAAGGTLSVDRGPDEFRIHASIPVIDSGGMSAHHISGAGA